MKKYIFIILFLTCLFFNTMDAVSKNKCTNVIYPNNLNSQNLYTFLQTENLLDSVHKICSMNVCVIVQSSTIKQNITELTKKHTEYLKRKNEEAAIEANVKGFKIEKIELYSCM